MSFESYFKFTSYGLVVTAFASLVATGAVDFLSVLLSGLALSSGFWMDMRSVKRLRLKEWMWRALAIAYIPFVFVDASRIASSRLVALVHMTLFLAAVKLFQDKRDRDWVFLYLIAFFQILLAATLTFNAVFVGWLSLFIFFFISTLAAFEVRRARREVKSDGEEVVVRTRKAVRFRTPGNSSAPDAGASPVKPSAKSSSPRLGYLVGASLGQLILIAALALPLFFIIPRFGGGGAGLAGGMGPGLAVSGFSDTVHLGDVAQIKSSSRVMMRVKVDPQPNRWLRWRGVALDHYDGRDWTFSKPMKRVGGIDKERAGADSAGSDPYLPTFTIDPEDPYKRSRRETIIGEGKGLVSAFPSTIQPKGLMKQEFYLEPLSSTALFGARKWFKIQGPFRKLYVQDTGAVSVENRIVSRISYTVLSDIEIPSEAELRAEVASPYLDSLAGMAALYTQLPNEAGGDLITIDQRVGRLAREITRGQSNSYDKARSIESYLKTHYGYTLDLKASGPDPLSEFLFETHEGHCEYFATAMVGLLRTLHIPCRIITGLQMGEYNDISGLYTVRERDAHSWVEVYFPQANAWVEFDPTPSAGINDYSQGGIMSRLRIYLEAAEMFWMDYVVTLDRDQQANILIGFQHRLMLIKDAIVSYYISAKRWATQAISSVLLGPGGAGRILVLSIILVLFIILCIAAQTARAFRKLGSLGHSTRRTWWQRVFILPAWRRAFWIKKDRRVTAVLFYEQMLSILGRAGANKPPDQTPLEFAASAGSSIHANARERVQTIALEITNIYNRIRFGGATLDEPESRRIADLLSQLKSSLRAKA
jgi:hypothetical protein